MPSLSERSRNNVRVGIFVSISIILAMSVIIMLTDILSTLNKSVETYTVQFNVSSGVSNLKSGADVRIGGLSMGKVKGVRPQMDGEPFEIILVDIELDSKVTLYDNAIILLSSPLLGAESWLDCPSVGNPESGNPVGPGGTVSAMDSVGMLTTLLGPGNASTAETIVDDLKATMQSARSFAANMDTRSVPILENLDTMTGDARAVVDEVRNENWPSWSESVDRIFVWAESATTNFDDTIEEGRLLMTDMRSVVEENREGVSAIVSNSESFSNRLNTEIADKASALLDRGRDGLDEAVAALTRIRDDHETWSVDIGESLGNASLASQQLKLAMIEIRRSPWKILYKPTDKELEHELLYEATRSFAVAAADMKAASISVNRILERHGNEVAQDRELYERITRALLDPLERYEKAQQLLFDVLVMETE
ncbi:MAG: hypothetical protein IIB54_13820 [Planctomycetes bacterium]|nr:hypothetical protein [Planctomycetota bacterium]